VPVVVTRSRGRLAVVLGGSIAIGCASGGGGDGGPFGGLGDPSDGSDETRGFDSDEDPGDAESTAGDSDETTGSGVRCAGVTCDPKAACIEDQCVCATGFVGDGLECFVPDGCEDEPCHPGVACMDDAEAPNGFTCGACPTGYEGDGITCTDVDGCAEAPCFPDVDCTDVAPPGEGFTCGACPAGYEGDGITCTDVDGCAAMPCYAGVECTDVAAPEEGFTCGPCPAGTFGDGIDCMGASEYSVGSTTTSFNAGPLFRGNGYVADADGFLADFDLYLGRSGACNLDFYVFESNAANGVLTQLWRNTVIAAVGTGYVNSGIVDLPITNGTYYVLGVGWNCSATYYYDGSGWDGFDAGIGLFANNRWDNAYPGPSDPYLPPSTGTSSLAYAQIVRFAQP
jgi:hypothetical protein